VREGKYPADKKEILHLSYLLNGTRETSMVWWKKVLQGGKVDDLDLGGGQ